VQVNVDLTECEEGYIPDGFGSCVPECDENYTLNIEGECVLEEGTSCESFNFNNITSNWQESAVVGIRFNIILSLPGVTTLSITPINFPQPINFGLPSNYTVGGGLSADSAADLSALIVDRTIWEIVNTYGRQNLTGPYIAMKFRERLIQNYRDYTAGGGRVQFNYTGQNFPTPYQTKFFGNGSCNN
jgi:hypothetical protein